MQSATLPWLDGAEWSPQYRQTLLLGGGADFVTMPLDDVRACPHSGASEIIASVAREHVGELYRLIHPNRLACRRAARFGRRYPSTRRPPSSPMRKSTIATTNSTWTNEPMV